MASSWLSSAGNLWHRDGRPALLGILLFLSLLAPPALSQTIRIGGSGSTLATMRLLVDAFRKSEPGFAATVVPNLGSSGALRALNAGAVDLALISRPLKESEQSPQLIATIYGRVPFVLATNHAGASGIDTATLADVYANRLSTWPDGKPIRLVLRPLSDSDSDALRSLSPAMATAVEQASRREGMHVALTDQDAAAALVRLPDSLGPTSLSILLGEGYRLQALAIDGVPPLVDGRANPAYPHTKTLTAVLLDNAPPALKRFVAFLDSSEAHTILVRTGHLPPRR